MKGEIELYNISFLILKVELHFKSVSCYMLLCHSVFECVQLICANYNSIHPTICLQNLIYCDLSYVRYTVKQSTANEYCINVSRLRTHKYDTTSIVTHVTTAHARHIVQQLCGREYASSMLSMSTTYMQVTLEILNQVYDAWTAVTSSYLLCHYPPVQAWSLCYVVTYIHHVCNASCVNPWCRWLALVTDILCINRYKRVLLICVIYYTVYYSEFAWKSAESKTMYLCVNTLYVSEDTPSSVHGPVHNYAETNLNMSVHIGIYIDYIEMTLYTLSLMNCIFILFQIVVRNVIFVHGSYFRSDTAWDHWEPVCHPPNRPYGLNWYLNDATIPRIDFKIMWTVLHQAFIQRQSDSTILARSNAPMHNVYVNNRLIFGDRQSAPPLLCRCNLYELIYCVYCLAWLGEHMVRCRVERSSRDSDILFNINLHGVQITSKNTYVLQTGIPEASLLQSNIYVSFYLRMTLSQ